MGGAAHQLHIDSRELRQVSIAGAILWGVLLGFADVAANLAVLFQSQGRFFGGCCFEEDWDEWPVAGFNRRGDSLGGAAPQHLPMEQRSRCFNRRGDSLGGAAAHLLLIHISPHVSIAGAILWGVLRIGDEAAARLETVSIAGAILWGVLRQARATWVLPQPCFNRRGDSLGGAACNGRPVAVAARCFNRRGDSLGGAALHRLPVLCLAEGFNRRGDSLGGAAR